MMDGRKSVGCALPEATLTHSQDNVAPRLGLKTKTNRLLDGGIGWQMYGPGCVVILLLVVPPSNWFWHGQVKIPGTVPFKAASLPLPCSVRDDTPSLRLPVLGRSALHPTPHLPSFGHPCGGASIRALFFAAVPLGSRQPLPLVAAR